FLELLNYYSTYRKKTIEGLVIAKMGISNYKKLTRKRAGIGG
ncbi:unnamed protein product, partial [marine sediment metagenome]